MRIGLFLVATFLFWWPCVAQHQSKGKAGADKNNQNQTVAPTHVVIDPPFPTVANTQNQSATQQQPPEKPLPRFLRPEWAIVYITTVYVFFTGLTLLAIKRQAKDAAGAAGTAALSAQNTLNEIKRQADLTDAQLNAMQESGKQVNKQIQILERSVTATEKSASAASENIELYISKERARLRIEMKPLSLPAVPDPAYTVDFAVSIYGSTPAFITESLCVAYIFPWEVVDNPELGDKIMFPIHSLPVTIPANNQPLDCYVFLSHNTDSENFFIGEAREKRMFAGIRGVIKYMDVFGRKRETAFRYTWNYLGMYGLSPELGEWVKSGSPEENSET
jgi:hypothetical protein